MRMVLGISTVLGIIGVVAAFGLFYLGERVFHLDRARIQTLMYLKLSVAGHLTIFLTRTRGPFWSIRPAKILWIAVLGTQTVATLIAVYGLFMTPLGWGWAAFVWGYALLWFLLNDRVKLLAYRIFDPVGAVPKSGEKVEAKSDTKAESKREAKAEPKPEAKATEPKPDAKATETKSDAKAAEPKPDAKAAEPKPDAKAAEPKPDAKATEPKPDAKATEPKPDAKANDPKSDAKPEAKPDTKAEPKPETRAKPEPEVKDEPKPQTKVEPEPEDKAKTPSDLTPQIAKRAYELYQERSRKDGPAVQDWEKAEREVRKDEVKAESKPDAKATEAKPDAKATEPKPEAKTPSDLTPQLVKRVHELYEELGREEVRAVEDLEKTEREVREHEAHK
jgi:H+-transporting ATPase